MLRLRFNHVSYEEIESIMSLLYPRDKDTIRNMVRCAIEDLDVPSVKDIQIVHYDEQHPKAGRNQKFRLTLLDGVTRMVIAEELLTRKTRIPLRDSYEEISIRVSQYLLLQIYIEDTAIYSRKFSAIR